MGFYKKQPVPALQMISSKAELKQDSKMLVEATPKHSALGSLKISPGRFSTTNMNSLINI